jgi:NAD(P)-dependent dehydrogenase (short-subunit alcohol dehydrogenase family)
MTEELFDRVYSVNVKAPYFLVAELAPLMAKRGKGAIVNLSTMAADYGAPGMSVWFEQGCHQSANQNLGC